MKYIDLFGGIGGFSEGIRRVNNFKETQKERNKKSWTNMSNPNRELSTQRRSKSAFSCVGYYEIDKYAVQIYNKNFGTNYKPTDITRLKTEQIPDFDLLCSGFPCQAFSIAGKRKGFEDTRGSLFFEIARIIKAKKPKLLLLENVKGLLSHGTSQTYSVRFCREKSEGGKTFAVILSILDELGYDVEWQVLNSKHFGVPQNRERVFIIGHLRGTGGGQVFPIGETNEQVQRLSKETWCMNTQKRDKNRPSLLKNPNAGEHGTICKKEEAYCLDSGNNMCIIHNIYGGFGETKPREFHDVSPTIRTPKGGGHLPMVARAVLTPDRINKRQHGRRIKEDGEPSFTLTGQDKHGVMIRDGRDNRSCLRSGRTPEVGFEGNSIRRLTPTECERLQGFPDRWTEGVSGGVSDTQRYKQLGNAVTVNVIEAIIKRIIEVTE